MDISKIVRYGYHLMLKSSWIAHFFMFMDSSLIFKSKKEGHGYQIFSLSKVKGYTYVITVLYGHGPAEPSQNHGHGQHPPPYTRPLERNMIFTSCHDILDIQFYTQRSLNRIAMSLNVILVKISFTLRLDRPISHCKRKKGSLKTRYSIKSWIPFITEPQI